MNITTLLDKVYFAPRLKKIDFYANRAGELQHRVLDRLVRMAEIQNGERNMIIKAFILMKTLETDYPYRLTKR